MAKGPPSDPYSNDFDAQPAMHRFAYRILLAAGILVLAWASGPGNVDRQRETAALEALRTGTMAD